MFTTGTIIDGRYELQSHLGDGGMGSVFQAKQLDVGRIVALKFLHPGLIDSEENQARFLREAKVLYDIHHPNLPVFYHIGTWSNCLYMVMEHLDGKSLRVLLDREGKLAPLRVLKIGKQVCDAVEAAHEHGVVHRDLKPNNIMILDSPEPDSVKVVDFGLARVTDSSHEMQKLTQTGLLIGTAHYMSPEQCLGQKADARSDVYSLGCVLYEALTGAPPVEADNPIGLLHKHVSEEFDWTTIQQLDPSGRIESVIKRSTSKKPNDRFQLMSDFASELSQIIETSSADQFRTVTPKNKQKQSRTSLLVSVLTIPIVAAAALYMFAPQQTNQVDAVINSIKVNSLPQHVPSAMVSAAANLRGKGKVAEAGEIAYRALQDNYRELSDGEMGMALRIAIQPFLDAKEFQSAHNRINTFRRQVRSSDNVQRAVCWLMDGETCFDSGKYSEAIACYQRALTMYNAAVNPSHSAIEIKSLILIAMAKTYNASGHPTEAQECLAKVFPVTLNGISMSFAWLEESKARILLGQESEALSAYEKAKSYSKLMPSFADLKTSAAKGTVEIRNLSAHAHLDFEGVYKLDRIEHSKEQRK